MMNARVLLGWITDFAYEEGFTLYAVAAQGPRLGRLPTATVVSDKVNGKISVHEVTVREAEGKVVFFSGKYFDHTDSPLENAMKYFGSIIQETPYFYV